MPRRYSKELKDSLDTADDKSIGVELAKLCVRANLPSLYLTEVLGVSRMTIHSWFRGSPIRHKNTLKIEKLIELINEDLKNGGLPAKTMLYAKAYLGTINL
jgi:hypothetical protein